MIPSDPMHPKFDDRRLRPVLLILMIFSFIFGFADLVSNRSMALLTILVYLFFVSRFFQWD